MESNTIKLIRLEPETEILPFDCGDTDLNGFLFDDAKKYAKDLIAVTYLIQNDTKTIAYFNYLNDKISHTDLDGSIEKLPPELVFFYLKKRAIIKVILL